MQPADEHRRREPHTARCRAERGHQHERVQPTLVAHDRPSAHRHTTGMHHAGVGQEMLPDHRVVDARRLQLEHELDQSSDVRRHRRQP